MRVSLFYHDETIERRVYNNSFHQEESPNVYDRLDIVQNFPMLALFASNYEWLDHMSEHYGVIEHAFQSWL